MNHFMGIDSSTTATKALLIDGDGSVVGVGRSTYDFSTPQPLWAEQDPGLWWTATVDAIRQVLAKTGVPGTDVQAIGLTGQMHGLVLLDTDGAPLRPAILWNDQRTAAECDQIRDLVGRDELVAISGNDALTGFTAPKMLWVRNHEPDVYERVAHMLLPKDYVRYRMTGSFATDVAGGSGTILFDLARRTWSGTLTDALGIPAEWLPQTHEGPDVTGTLTREAADALGLSPGTPVVAGGGDQAANAVGVGAVVPGVTAMSIGTSGVVFSATDRPVIDPQARLHSFCHAVPDAWHLMGVMLSAAGSLQWFRDALAPDRSFADLDAAAEGAPPGSNGLVFLPYLSGERTPHPDPLARGAFIGLTVRHGLGDMARAVMEGVALGLRDSVELVRDSGPIGEIRASGGGASSRIWVRIVADVCGVPVRTVGTSEGAAHGAALLAAVGGGAFPDVEAAADAAVTFGDPVDPGPDASRYDETYDVFRGLYPTLRSDFHTLSSLDH